MIRSIRRILSHLLKCQVVTDDVLLTALAEAERIVNDRPLVPVYDDPSHPHALRPNDFLLLRHNPGLQGDELPLRERLTRRWKQSQLLVNSFWKQWKNEYLPNLQYVRKWLHPHRNVRKGDLVLLCKMDSPRGEWPMGLVVDTYLSGDGLVRSVLVKTSNRGTVRRDVRSLCLLEGAEE